MGIITKVGVFNWKTKKPLQDVRVAELDSDGNILNEAQTDSTGIAEITPTNYPFIPQVMTTRTAQADIEIVVFDNGWADEAKQVGNHTITTSFSDLPSVNLTLPKAGTYLVWGVVDFLFDVVGGTGTGPEQASVGLFDSDNNLLDSSAIVAAIETEDTRITQAQVWLITSSVDNLVIKLRAIRDGNRGTVTLTTIANRYTNCSVKFSWR